MDLLDTDHIGVLQRKPTPELGRLRKRMDQELAKRFFLPIVSFHEQGAGWNAYLNRARDPAGIVKRCRRRNCAESRRRILWGSSEKRGALPPRSGRWRGGRAGAFMDQSPPHESAVIGGAPDAGILVFVDDDPGRVGTHSR